MRRGGGFLLASLLLTLARGESTPVAEPAQAVPTFHCIGLTWRSAAGAAGNPCSVRYRAAGESPWRDALPLWFDPNPHADAPEYARQYRGSIVDLQPGTRYEISLQLASGETQAVTAATWSEQFPVQAVRRLPAGTSTTPLVITEGGSAATGYLVYEPAPGETAIIDVGEAHPEAARIEASFVILRGVILKGGTQNGLVLGAVTDVVVEGCDISGWGSNKPGLPWGQNLQAAIYSDAPVLERIVVQRCRLHHPRTDSNSWGEHGHPEGPQGITFKHPRGQLVIRYNEIYSDDQHCFNDGMGETNNFSYAGFPHRDSDIYGNRISHCWDDAIEAEGANLNVRIWANYLDTTFNALGLAATSLGPQYVYRNLSGFSRTNPPGVGNAPYPSGGSIFKLGTKRPRADTMARGQVYLFHNTILQPLMDGAPAGMRRGAYVTDPAYGVWNITARNNILHTRPPGAQAVRDPLADPSNDFDFDLYTGELVAAPGAQSHGHATAPQYDASSPATCPTLAVGSPGHDAGAPLANFNSLHRGAGPDIGAAEAGLPPFRFGVDADWTAWLRAAENAPKPTR